MTTDAAVLNEYSQERERLLLEYETAGINQRSGMSEEVRTSPIYSLRVKCNFASNSANDSITTQLLGNEVIKQYSMLGAHIGEHELISKKEPILHNTRTPFSTFICGAQGSGKSYTLSVMLENCIKPNPKIGKVGPQQAGLVLHYDTGSNSSPSETVGLCRLQVPVRVLVSATNYHTLSAKYKAAANGATNVKVYPLYLHDHQVTVESMMKLMAFNDGSGKVPLYMTVIQRLLREMAMERKNFSFKTFKDRIGTINTFTKDQQGPLDMRLDTLQSFMSTNKKSKDSLPTIDAFANIQAGTLTIIDLSCPFVDVTTAQGLFDICVGLFKARQPDSGSIIALDEAHKFIDDTNGSSGLAEHILTTVREQRHNAVRVVIATQEPTISTKFLDLCSVSIVHSFSSPAWYKAIVQHLAGANGERDNTILDQIVNLDVGESLVFARSAYVCGKDERTASKLGKSYFKMKTRSRKGKDQGMSKLSDEVNGTK